MRFGVNDINVNFCLNFFVSVPRREWGQTRGDARGLVHARPASAALVGWHVIQTAKESR